jgi:hypothetical protein
VFPSTKYIICTWHINGNIAKNLKVKFENGEAWKKFLEEWNAVMYANQAAEFEDNWRKIREKYISKPDVINYLESTWISMKENFVSHWINQYPHLGGHTSSRVESSHAALKSYLITSTGDLLNVKSMIELAICSQRREYKAQSEIEQTKILQSLNNFFFQKFTENFLISP